MSLVFAGIVPHPTILIQNIGKEAFLQIEESRHALERLEQELYISKPDRIIIITPHEGIFEDAFSINAHTELYSQFEKFGDMTTSYHWRGAPELAARIQHTTKMSHVHTRLVSNEHIGHGASIPLSYLTTHLKDVHVLPIGYSNLSAKEHISFGHAIKEAVMNSDHRIAVIASGDMAHTLQESSPAGFHTDGPWYDSEIRRLLSLGDIKGLHTLSPERIQHADECLHRSLLILCGIIEEMKYSFEEYAYEAPFGVGYLTGQFHI